MDVEPGVSAVEALWLHEYECPAIVFLAQAA